jgi:TniQ protein
MGSVPDWLPGCYRNFPCRPGEALPGFLLRLAEANGYAGIPALLRTTGIADRKLTQAYTYALRDIPEMLTALGRMAIGDPDHLNGHAARVLLRSSAYLIHGIDIDRDAILHERAQVCPRCLADDSLIKEEHELAPVTVCTSHEALLIDECPACHHPLDWKRPRLMQCGRCGADFRAIAREPVDQEICEVAGDFAALAPFRVVNHPEEPETTKWDTMFRVFKALALPDSDWAVANWPKRFVRLMPVKARHEIVVQLAGARRGGSYHLTDLQQKARSALSPLTVIPRPYVLEHCAMKFLSEGWMPDEHAEALCSPHPLTHQPTGAEVFQGRPPTLRTLDEVLSFLAADSVTVDGLMARKILKIPSDPELGYDIDELLAAQHFLQAGVLTLPELSIVVGVRLDWDDLLHSSLLRPWNPYNPRDMRVAVEDVLAIQQRLTATWATKVRPENAVSLRNIAMQTERPFQTVSLAVMLATRGQLNSFGWETPYDWGSLLISETDQALLHPDQDRR